MGKNRLSDWVKSSCPTQTLESDLILVHLQSRIQTAFQIGKQTSAVLNALSSC